MRDRTLSMSLEFQRGRARTNSSIREYTPNSSFSINDDNADLIQSRRPTLDNHQNSTQLSPIETLGNIAVNFNNREYLQLSKCGVNSFVFLTFISIWQVFLGTFLVFHSLLIIPGFHQKNLTIGFSALFLGVIFFFSGTNAMQGLGQENRLNSRLYFLCLTLLTRGLLILSLGIVISTDVNYFFQGIINWNEKICQTLEFPRIPYSSSFKSTVLAYPLVCIGFITFSIFDIYCGLVTFFHLQWVKNEQERIRNRTMNILNQILV